MMINYHFILDLKSLLFRILLTSTYFGFLFTALLFNSLCCSILLLSICETIPKIDYSLFKLSISLSHILYSFFSFCTFESLLFNSEFTPFNSWFFLILLSSSISLSSSSISMSSFEWISLKWVYFTSYSSFFIFYFSISLTSYSFA